MRIDSSAGRTVGRDPELEQLNVALEGLAAGSAACITVEGEPGIGKTHLLTVFRRRAEEAGCLALAGSATEFERDLPFSVWVDALDAYVASQELDLGDGWSAELVEELSRVIPSVRPRSDGAPATVADERYRSHRAVRSLLELLADERPLVVVLDDLHWSDEASIELLAGLLQRPPEAPVLLAIAFRAGRAPARLSPRSRFRPFAGSGSRSSTMIRRPSCSARSIPVRQRPWSATPVGTRSTSSSSSAPARMAPSQEHPTRASTSQACPSRPRWRRRSRTSSRRCWRTSSRCSAPPRSRESHSSRIWRARSPSCPRRTCSACSTRCSSSTSCAPRRCRADSSSGTRSSAGRSTSPRRRVGGLRPMRGPRTRWPPAGRAPRTVRITSSSTRARGTNRPSSSSSRQAPRWRRARRRRPPAGTRPPSPCSPRRTRIERS